MTDLQIKDWLLSTFSGPEPKTIIEIGANDGTDTAWLSKLPNSTLHAFEAAGNIPSFLPANVIWNTFAISDHCGTANFYRSYSTNESESVWTQSSSIHQPTGHLDRYPSILFTHPQIVPTLSLDCYCLENKITSIDFIWADMQGAEGGMIRGAPRLLSATRYLYMEYSEIELFSGQTLYPDILHLLPGRWAILYKWPDDILLRNDSSSPPPAL